MKLDQEVWFLFALQPNHHPCSKFANHEGIWRKEDKPQRVLNLETTEGKVSAAHWYGEHSVLGGKFG
jgi:hypothetical protein